MPRFGPEEEELVLKVLRSGEVSPYFRNPAGGEMVQTLEKEFAEFVGVDHAVVVSNGTSALQTAYLACGIRPRDRVVVPAHTFIATASMVLAVGAVPVFADVDVSTYCLDASYMFTDERAVVPVDLLGYPVDMKPIYEYAKDRKMVVIEDAAQALGSYTPRGKHAGSEYNDCATWSFQQTKNLGIGEGGMVTTNDREIARRCRSIRSHGSGYLDDPNLTFNFRMTELHAAVALAQLRKYDKTLRSIRENATFVVEHLPDGLKPPPYWQTLPGQSDPYGGNSVVENWNAYMIGCIAEKGFDRKGFVRKMQELGVSKGVPGSVVSLGYERPLYHKRLFEGCPRTACEQALALSESWVWLDIHRFKPLDEVKRDVELMNEALI